MHNVNKITCHVSMSSENVGSNTLQSIAWPWSWQSHTAYHTSITATKCQH